MKKWRKKEMNGKRGNQGVSGSQGQTPPLQKKLIKGIPPGIADGYIASALDRIKSKSTDHDFNRKK